MKLLEIILHFNTELVNMALKKMINFYAAEAVEHTNKNKNKHNTKDSHLTVTSKVKLFLFSLQLLFIRKHTIS